MIKNFEYFINESIFSKTFYEKLLIIDNLIEKLEVIHDELITAWNNYESDPRKNRPILDKFYLLTFKIRNRVINRFIDLLDDRNLNQEKIDNLVERWEDFERNTLYGSYNTVRRTAVNYSNEFISLSNKFLKKLGELKKSFIIDLDTNDIFVLAKREGSNVTPCRKSFNDIRELKMKNKYYDIDPLGEETWED